MSAAGASARDADRLTLEQCDFFQRQGYLILPATVADDHLQQLQTTAQQQLATAAAPLEYEADVHYPGSPIDYELPGGRSIRRLLNAWSRARIFRDWAVHAAVTTPIRQLLGSGDIRLELAHHNCIMSKHPQHSSSTLWHQDFRYWQFAENHLITAWLALGRETARNGCMRLIPGSHHLQLDAERFDQRRFFRTDSADNRDLMQQAVRAELSAGDLLLFHSGLLHAAGRNHGDNVKLALVFTYRVADNLPLPGGRAAEMGSIDPAHLG